MSIPVLLLILTFIVAVLGLIAQRYYKDKLPNWLFVVIVAILFVSLIGAVYQQHQDELAAQYAENSGKLTGTIEDKNVTYPILKIGTAQFVQQGPQGTPMFMIGSDPLTVWLENGELKVNLTLRDQNGDVIAKLVANEWQVNPNLIFDRNFDDRALEVINAKGDVVLQLVFDGTAVQFCGKFYLSDGSQVGIGDNIIEKAPAGTPLKLTFAPIFKYPSTQYPAQRK